MVILLAFLQQISLTKPLQSSLLFASLDLHSPPLPGTGGAVSTPASVSALWKQCLMKQDLILVSQTFALLWASLLLWERSGRTPSLPRGWFPFPLCGKPDL